MREVKPTIQDMARVIALALQAKSFTLIDNKVYRFYLTGERQFEITKQGIVDDNVLMKVQSFLNNK